MKLCFIEARKLYFLLMVFVVVVVSTIYVNILGLNILGLSNGSSNNRLYNDWKTDMTGIAESAGHPSSSFYRRGEKFDTTVSRERATLMCLHDKMLNMGVSLIRELRCLGNQELIQVYHCGKKELSLQSVDLLLSLDNRVELVDACSDLSSRGIISARRKIKFQNFWLKPLALIHTDVRHVLMLDADDILMRDPAIVRKLDGYVKTGTTFFYDRVRPHKRFLTGNDSGEMYLHRLLHQFNYSKFKVSGGYAPSHYLLQSFAFRNLSCHEMDSSMVVVDKARAGKTVMDILLWLITKERFRFQLSWGDKETFWLAFELAHVPYFFSPWGISAVNSVPNEDMKNHPDTLCNSMLHFMPVEATSAETAEILYVNSKSLIDPYPEGFKKSRVARNNKLFNTAPTHMTPRQERKELNLKAHPREKFQSDCLVGMGSTPLPSYFSQNLLRRRVHFLGLNMGVLGSLEHCETYTNKQSP